MSPEKLKDYSERKRPPAHASCALRRPTRSPTPLVVHRPRHDVPFPRRVRRPEREQQRSNRAPETALLTLCPCRTQTKIRDTLNNLILKSPQNWQTSVGLPFFQIEGTVVEWDEVRFDGMPSLARPCGHTDDPLTPVLLLRCAQSV